LIKRQKLPLFPIIEFLPHKREGFDKKNQVFLHYKFLKNSQVAADPVALALISPPLALSTKTKELFGPFNPIASQKIQIGSKAMRKHK
jgi:hypothetical protein